MSTADRDRLFLASIVKSVPAMIFVKDARELRFELFNPAGEQLIGLEEKQMLGKSDRDFFPAEQADFFIKTDRDVLAGKTIVEIQEEPIETPHGRRWLYTRKVPVLDESGEPRYLLGISIDVTARKLAQDTLDERNRELQAKEEELKKTLAQLLAMEGLALAAASVGEQCRRLVEALDQGDTGKARALAEEALRTVEQARKGG